MQCNRINHVLDTYALSYYKQIVTLTTFLIKMVSTAIQEVLY